MILEELTLDGALVINAAKGAKVVVKGLKVTNPGWELEPFSSDDAESYKETLQIRGMRLKKKAAVVYSYDEPGEYKPV